MTGKLALRIADDAAVQEEIADQPDRVGVGALESPAPWVCPRSAAACSARLGEHLGERLGAEHALPPPLEVGHVSRLDAGDGSLR